MREGEKSVSGFFGLKGGKKEKSKVRRGEEGGAEVYQKHWEIRFRELGGL